MNYVELKEKIDKSDCILIGAGAGLSTAAGVKMDGEGFEKNFEPWIKKYGFTDLYTSSFYEFETEEEKWAYWGKYIKYIDIDMEATPLYRAILDLVKEKNYFVITTNVDDQFYKAGFDSKKIFRVQGSYRLLQCSNACHNKLYDAEEICKKIVANTNDDLKIPSDLVPYCPVCSEKMEVNLRKDAYFVQDDLWYEQNKKYEQFLNENRDKNVLLLEFGVGFNTPGIIRFPFEKMVSENKNWRLIRFNKDETKCFIDIGDRFEYSSENLKNFFNI